MLRQPPPLPPNLLLRDLPNHRRRISRKKNFARWGFSKGWG